MADNEQDNDEYKFVDMDNMDTNFIEEEAPGAQPVTATPVEQGTSPKKDIKRNAISVVVIVICVMVGYKIISHWVSAEKNKQTEVNSSIVQTPPAAPPVVNPVVVQQPVQPVQPIQPAISNQQNAELTKKVSAIEVTQDSVRAEVSSVNQQVNTVNNNVGALSSQIENLNQMITTLSNQLAKQSEEINTLMLRTQPKHVVKPVRKYLVRLPTYHIQAVIPGRAWLIATNGSTITVREGTKIAGYGIIKLIDATQGRVITSSGRVIKFSQEDS